MDELGEKIQQRKGTYKLPDESITITPATFFWL